MPEETNNIYGQWEELNNIYLGVLDEDIKIAVENKGIESVNAMYYLTAQLIREMKKLNG